MKRYKLENTLNDRKDSTDLLLTRHPDRVPIILEYNEKIKKLLLPRDANVGMLLHKVRQMLSLKSEEGVFIFIVQENGSFNMVKVSEMISQVYEQNKQEDKMLYVLLKTESVFGGINYNWRLQYSMFKVKPYTLRKELGVKYRGALCLYIFFIKQRYSVVFYISQISTVLDLKRYILLNFLPDEGGLLPSEIKVSFVDPSIFTPTIQALELGDFNLMSMIEVAILTQQDDSIIYCVCRS